VRLFFFNGRVCLICHLMPPFDCSLVLSCAKYLVSTALFRHSSLDFTHSLDQSSIVISVIEEQKQHTPPGNRADRVLA